MSNGYGARTQSYEEYRKDHEYYESHKRLKGRRLTPRQRADEIRRQNNMKSEREKLEDRTRAGMQSYMKKNKMFDMKNNSEYLKRTSEETGLGNKRTKELFEEERNKYHNERVSGKENEKMKQEIRRRYNKYIKKKSAIERLKEMLKKKKK